MKIKVMITDDQRLMREGLKTILELEQDLTVVHLAENGRDALDKIADAQPDVILMDIRMPVMDGVECTGIIKRQYPNVKVLILTTFDDDVFIIDALKNGAIGYILKDLSSEKLVGAIRDAHAGNSIMQPEIAAKVISHITGSTAGGASASTAGGASASISGGISSENTGSLSGLTPAAANCSTAIGAPDAKLPEELTDRERDVLQLVGKGMSNVEIAKKLYISEGTVKNYMSNLYSKLELNDRSKLMLYAIENKCV